MSKKKPKKRIWKIVNRNVEDLVRKRLLIAMKYPAANETAEEEEPELRTTSATCTANSADRGMPGASIVRTRGIVVAYDALHGVLLLRHRSFPTTEDLAQQYLTSSEDRGFWFASFTWASIADEDKKCIQSIQACSKRVKGNKKKRPVYDSIRTIILGCEVNCTVTKDSKWHATWLSISVKKRKFPLPDRRVTPDHYRNQPNTKDDSRQRRERRMNQKGQNNFARPWGGLSG